MTGNTMTNKKSFPVMLVTVLINALIFSSFLVGHCFACHVIYRSYYPFDIFNLFLLVIVLPVM
jgi:hypothetical protein